MPQLEFLTANFRGEVRTERLNGREYLVAPVSMLREGVLNGSKGPLYYPSEEIAQNVDAWNGIPLTLDHPTENGQSVSARSPAVLEKYGIGYVFNAVFNGKLRAEAWFDVEKTNKADSTILPTIRNRKPLDLSTGLFTKNDFTRNGKYRGKDYTATATQYRPDHLAILPGKRGACSVEDGCGVLVNRSSNNSQLLNTKESTMTKQEMIEAIVANCDCWSDDDRALLNGLSEDQLTFLHGLEVDDVEPIANTLKAGAKIGAEQVTVNMGKDHGKGHGKMKFVKDMTDEELEAELNSRKKPTKNTDNGDEPLTDSEWLEKAPEGIRSVVQNAMRMEKAQKDKLIATITANKRNKFSKDALVGKPLEELELLAELAANSDEESQSNRRPNYAGAANAPTSNFSADDDNDRDFLPLPTMNFEQAS